MDFLEHDSCRACNKEIPVGQSTHISYSFNPRMKILEAFSYIGGVKVNPSKSKPKFLVNSFVFTGNLDGLGTQICLSTMPANDENCIRD